MLSLPAPKEPLAPNQFTLDYFRYQLSLVFAAELEGEQETHAHSSLILRGALAGVKYNDMDNVRCDVVEAMMGE